MSLKDYLTNTNTIKNPLDTVFPNTRKAITGQNPPPIVQEPLKTKAISTIQDLNIKIKAIEKDTSAVLIVAVIGFILYSLSSKK